MSVFKKFDKTDQLRSKISVSPLFEFASGTNGWRGNQMVSSSISLLDGPRSVFNQNPAISIRPIFRRDCYSTDVGDNVVTGSYPLSSSVKFVTIKSVDSTTENEHNLYKRHWDVLQRAYAGLSMHNAEYQTGSYDYYSLFFKGNSTNIISNSGSVGKSTVDTMSSSFTIECIIKPFLTASVSSDFVIASRNGVFEFGITGSTGQLYFSGSFLGRFTSSYGPSEKNWSHICVRGQSNTGSFLIDLVDAGMFTYTGSMSVTSPAQPALTIGNKFSSPTALGGAVESGSNSAAAGFTNRAFFGMMHEARFWSIRRSDAQLSASFNTVLFVSSSTGLISYYRMNQGPLYSSTSDPALYTIGSGVLDHSSNAINLSLGSFTRKGPNWLPNDNSEFFAPKQLAVASTNLSSMKMFNIPSIMYGRQIATGSVEITCKSYSATGYELIRVLKDDGRGGLYISGSMCSSSLENKQSYKGVEWNKVGNIFYGEGLIVIKDPSLFDFAFVDATTTTHPDDILSISFRGQSIIPTYTLMCRADSGEFNGSNNQTFSTYNQSTGKYELLANDQPTYITAVGLYDEHYRLVGVAKLAQPIRKRIDHRLNIRLRMDF